MFGMGTGGALMPLLPKNKILCCPPMETHRLGYLKPRAVFLCGLNEPLVFSRELRLWKTPYSCSPGIAGSHAGYSEPSVKGLRAAFLS